MYIKSLLQMKLHLFPPSSPPPALGPCSSPACLPPPFRRCKVQPYSMIASSFLQCVLYLIHLFVVVCRDPCLVRYHLVLVSQSHVLYCHCLLLLYAIILSVSCSERVPLVSTMGIVRRSALRQSTLTGAGVRRKVSRSATSKYRDEI